MNLYRLLSARQAKGTPLRVALIGAGKFGSMFLSQVRRAPGLHLAAIADLNPPRARASLVRVGWPQEQYDAPDLSSAIRSGKTHITDDADRVIAEAAVDIVVDATGSPAAGIHHALECARNGKHIIMVNVEADALA